MITQYTQAELNRAISQAQLAQLTKDEQIITAFKDRLSALEAVLEATEQELAAKNLEIVQLRADLTHARSGRA